MQTPLCIAHTLATFTLVVGLTACDENVPTETRAPSRTTPVSVELDEANSTQQSDVSTSSIALPVNQSVSTVAPNPAFKINQIGTGPNGIFQITRPGSNQPALQALTNGRGAAGVFQINNTYNSNQSALQAQTNGSGRALLGFTTGTGSAGEFQISNVQNHQGALIGRTNGSGIAVAGLQSGTGPAGLFWNSNLSNNEPALQAQTNGSGFAVQAFATGSGGAGSFQLNKASSNATAFWVTTNGTGLGAKFEIQNANNSNSALLGQTNGSGSAVAGITTGTNDAGAFVINNASNIQNAVAGETNGSGVAVRGNASGTGSAGFFSITNVSSLKPSLIGLTNGSGPAVNAVTQGTGFALRTLGPSFFEGNVVIQGTLTKSAGSFRIDDPIDPEHKYLSHSFVESPDMMDVYNGNVALDAEGRATVDLPPYFEALNRDFRYQLTPIGAPGPNLYIAEGVTQNHFRIAGGRPYAHVSWQVTGVRHDTYAEEHRIKVEEEKTADEQKQRPAGHMIAQR